MPLIYDDVKQFYIKDETLIYVCATLLSPNDECSQHTELSFQLTMTELLT